VSKLIAVDEYVFTVLMRDLVEHDRSPSGYLVYLHLMSESKRLRQSKLRASYQSIAEATGLSKSAVQGAIRGLVTRQLLKVSKDTPTATPEYRVQKPWGKL
jgi:DNA-binding MarR family transcriptional regulator